MVTLLRIITISSIVAIIGSCTALSIAANKKSKAKTSSGAKEN